MAFTVHPESWNPMWSVSRYRFFLYFWKMTIDIPVDNQLFFMNAAYLQDFSHLW